MLGKVAAKLARKVRGKKKSKAPNPKIVDYSENLKILAKRKKAAAEKKRKAAAEKKRKAPAGRLVAGAGDMSEPGGSGKFRAGQKSRRSSSATTSNQAMSTAESGRLARGKAARGSKAFYDQAVKDKAAGKKLNAAQKDILENYNKEMRPASPKRKVSKKKAEAAAKLKKFKLKKFAGGGQMSRVGLSPAEEKRSGTMSEKKRAQNMQYGGKVKKYDKGGKIKVAAVPDWMKGLSEDEISEILGGPTRQPDGTKRHTELKKKKKKKVPVKRAKTGGQLKKYGHGGKIDHNTSRMNRLEELGRVDAEKAYTKKGKSNLRAEKKRIVKELNGNDFVARNYD